MKCNSVLHLLPSSQYSYEYTGKSEFGTEEGNVKE